MIKKITYLILFLLIIKISNGQDPHFSQYRFVPNSINPAFSTMFDDMQVGFLYRNQWSSLADPFKTPAFNLSYPIKNDRQQRLGGGALTIINDQSGENGIYSFTYALSALGVNLNLKDIFKQSFHRMQKETYLSFGFQAGFMQKSIDFNNLRSGSQWNNGRYDPDLDLGENFEQESKGMFHLSSGLMWYLEEKKLLSDGHEKEIDAFAGFTFYHINRPNESLNSIKKKLPVRFTFTGGSDIYDIGSWRITPQLVYMRQAKVNNLQLGSFFRYRFSKENGSALSKTIVGLGTFYRWKDAVILAAQFRYDNFDLGIAYDINTSGLSSLTGGKGAFEVGLSYHIPVTGRINFPKRPKTPPKKPKPPPELPEPGEKPNPTSLKHVLIKGKLQDNITKEPISTPMVIIDMETDETVKTVTPDADGEYEYKGEKGKTYKIKIDKRSYMPYDQEIKIDEKENRKEIENNIFLKPIRKGEKLIMKSIQFESRKIKILSSSEPFIKRLVKFMQDNEDIKIEISGHTDSTGSDALNNKLSEDRAKAVKEYLIEEGIEEERIESKGKGDKEPIAPNTTEEGKAKNRRVELKIIEE